MSLFSNEELTAMAERVRAQQAEERRQRHERDLERREREAAQSYAEHELPSAQSAPAASSFVYVERSRYQWERRMRQSWKNNRSFHPIWPKPASKPRKSRATNPVEAIADTPPTCGTLESVLGDAPVKKRRSRKQVSKAFTTGETLFAPSTTTESQPTGEKC